MQVTVTSHEQHSFAGRGAFAASQARLGDIRRQHADAHDAVTENAICPLVQPRRLLGQKRTLKMCSLRR